MQTPDSQIVSARFFEALRKLKEYKIIRGAQTFLKLYDDSSNTRNICRLEKEPHRDGLQLAWLTYLVRDFMVSPRWLLTGDGEFFEYGWDAEKVKSVHKSVHKEKS